MITVWNRKVSGVQKKHGTPVTFMDIFPNILFGVLDWFMPSKRH